VSGDKETRALAPDYERSAYAPQMGLKRERLHYEIEPFCSVIYVADTANEVAHGGEVSSDIPPNEEVHTTATDRSDQVISTSEHLTIVQRDVELNMANGMIDINTTISLSEELNLVRIERIALSIKSERRSPDASWINDRTLSLRLTHESITEELSCITSSSELDIKRATDVLETNGVPITLRTTITLSDTIQENLETITRPNTSDISSVGNVRVNILVLHINSTLQVTKCLPDSTQSPLETLTEPILSVVTRMAHKHATLLSITPTSATITTRHLPQTKSSDFELERFPFNARLRRACAPLIFQG